MSLFIVKIDDIKKAAIAAKSSVQEERAKLLEKLVKKRMNGFFGLFKKDRESAIEYVIENNFYELSLGWLTNGIADELLDACFLTKDNHAYLDKEDAEFVYRWLQKYK